MISSYKSKVSKYYEKLRENAEAKYEKNKAYTYAKIPIIEKLQSEINKKSSSLILSSINNPSFSEIEFNNMKLEIQNLRAQIIELLVENNLPMNFLDIVYNCSICHDTGYIGANKCQCYKKTLAKIYMQESDLKDLIEKYNFSKFDINLFPKQIDEVEGTNPRSNIRSIRNDINVYINNFEQTNDNLCFYGPVGSGKSFMTYCIAKELLERGYLVIYKSSTDLFNDLRTIRLEGDKNLENLIFNCDLLIIDDFGIEITNDYTSLDLFNLLNRKMLYNKKMLISTNLQIENFAEKYQERIYSRIMGNFKFFRFFGEDLRLELSKKKSKKTKDIT